MNKMSEDEIRKMAQESKNIVPDEYHNRMNQLLCDLTSQDKKESKKRNVVYRHRKVLIVAATIAFIIVIAIPVSGRVRGWLQRMQNMSKTTQEKYVEDIQRTNKDADQYSRKYTKEEINRKQVLQEKYEKDSCFPQKTLTYYETKKEVQNKNELYFVIEESKFYLPKDKLTDEELLEIIDHEHKVDYSLRQKNKKAIEEQKKEQTPPPGGMTKEYAIAYVRKEIARIWEVDTSKMKAKCEYDGENGDGKEDEWFDVELTPKGDGYPYDASVDAKKSTILCYGIDGEKAFDKQRDRTISEIDFNAIYIKIKPEIVRLCNGFDNISSVIAAYEKTKSKKMHAGRVMYVIRKKDDTTWIAYYSTLENHIYQLFRYNTYKQYRKESKKFKYIEVKIEDEVTNK